MANPKWSSRTSGYETAIWAAKIAFYFLGIICFGAAARAAVPAAAEALASALPGSWSSLRSWLAPPYLFIAVHFIILVIWKLSDQRQHHHDQEHLEKWTAEDRTTEPAIPTRVKSFEASPSAGLLRKPSPEIWRDEISISPMIVAILAPDPYASSPYDASCLTSVSGERSTASSAFVAKVEPESKSSIAAAAEVEDEAAAGMENDSMEATWKAIMEKSSRATAAPPPPPVAQRAGPSEASCPSASHDELNQRIADFIKKIHEQMGSRRRQM